MRRVFRSEWPDLPRDSAAIGTFPQMLPPLLLGLQLGQAQNQLQPFNLFFVALNFFPDRLGRPCFNYHAAIVNATSPEKNTRVIPN